MKYHYRSYRYEAVRNGYYEERYAKRDNSLKEINSLKTQFMKTKEKNLSISLLTKFYL